jgi:ankyrin repeat protein
VKKFLDKLVSSDIEGQLTGEAKKHGESSDPGTQVWNLVHWSVQEITRIGTERHGAAGMYCDFTTSPSAACATDDVIAAASYGIFAVVWRTRLLTSNPNYPITEEKYRNRITEVYGASPPLEPPLQPPLQPPNEDCPTPASEIVWDVVVPDEDVFTESKRTKSPARMSALSTQSSRSSLTATPTKTLPPPPSPRNKPANRSNRMSTVTLLPPPSTTAIPDIPDGVDSVHSYTQLACHVLSSLPLLNTPHHVLSTCTLLVQILTKVLEHEGKDGTTDELIDMTTRVIIATNPPLLSSTVWAIQQYSVDTFEDTSGLLQGIDGFSFATVRAAVEYCETCEIPGPLPDILDEFGNIGRYQAVTNAIKCVKTGNVQGLHDALTIIQQYDFFGAPLGYYGTVNLLNPACNATILSTCISNISRCEKILPIILKCKGLQVNARIGRYWGDMSGSSALHIAVMMGCDVSVVAMLLNAGGDRHLINYNSETPISLAEKSKHQSVISSDPVLLNTATVVLELLLCNPSELRIYDESRLCRIGNVRNLLMQAVDPNTLDESGEYCALISSVYLNHTNIVKLLLEDSRTDINVKNRKGETPLHYCAMLPSTPTLDQICMAKFLIERGADVSIQDDSGVTAATKAGASHVYILSNFLNYCPKTHNIHDLSKNKNHAGVQSLLLHGVDPNSPHETLGYTPLIAAVYNDDLTTAGVLLNLTPDPRPCDLSLLRFMKDNSSLASVNHPGRNGMTALHYAVQQNSLPMTLLLLNHFADRSLVDGGGRTPLDIAIAKNHEALIPVLKNDPKLTSICLAAASGEHADVLALLQQRVDINSKHICIASTPPAADWRAAKFFVYEPSSHLASTTASTRHEVFTPLIAACSHNRPEILASLLNAPNESVQINAVNLKGQTALMYAAACGNLQLILQLLQFGADRCLIDAKGRSAESWAKLKNMTLAGDVIRCDPAKYTLVDCARAHDSSGVDALLLQGFDVNRLDFGEPAIVAAAKSGSSDCIQRLAKADSLDFELRDENDESALEHACRLNQLSVVLDLLKLGAKRTPEATAIAAGRGHVLCGVVVNSDPDTVVIHDACALGKLLQVEALLLQGVRSNEIDKRAGRNACTPLMAAAASAGGGRRGKAVQIVVDRLLAEPSIKVNAKNSQGVTALMLAAGNGAIDLVKVLIKNGADKDCKDSKGRGALWWAYNGVPSEGYNNSGETDKNRFKPGIKNASSYLSACTWTKRGAVNDTGELDEEFARNTMGRRKSSAAQASSGVEGRA